VKNFLKWAAVFVGGVIGLLTLSGMSLETQRWVMLGMFLGWTTYAVPTAIEKLRSDLASRIQSQHSDLAERLSRLEHTLYGLQDRVESSQSK